MLPQVAHATSIPIIRVEEVLRVTTAYLNRTAAQCAPMRCSAEIELGQRGCPRDPVHIVDAGCGGDLLRQVAQWGRKCGIRFLAIALLTIALGAAAPAEQIRVKHIQLPNHGFMVARSEAGEIIARVEFTQVVEADEVTMRLTHRFVDGSIDDETTTYTQHGTFRLVRNHHIQKGPFFNKPFDFSVEDATGLATSRTADKNGATHVESEHIDLPDDLANGFIGTLLLNVPPTTTPFRVGMVAPVFGGRLIRIRVSPEGERPFQKTGQTFKATVFRIHPELGGVLGVIATLLGLQPKDVMVWILEGEQPAVVRVVGQLGGYGPVISSELEGTSFGK